MDEAKRHGRLFACLAGLAECLYLQARYAEAVPLFRDAALHALKSKSSGDFTLALHLLAEGYQAVGEYEKAIPLFQLGLGEYEIVDEGDGAAAEDAEVAPQSTSGTLIWRSHLTVRYFDRRHIRGEASLFKTDRVGNASIFERGDLPKSINVKDVEEDFLKALCGE